VRCRFLADAEVEMREAAAFYDEEAQGLGNRFLTEVEAHASLLRERPQLGGSINGLRRLLLGKFPFSLIYALDAAEIGGRASTKASGILGRQRSNLDAVG